MRGDKLDLETADEIAAHQQHKSAMAGGLAQRLAEALLGPLRDARGAAGPQRQCDRHRDEQRYRHDDHRAAPVECVDHLLAERDEDGLAQQTAGGPDDFHGEVVVAFVALKEDEEISSEALIAYCEESLVKYKVPQKIIFLDTLPKKGPGKIDKLSLKTLAA